MRIATIALLAVLAVGSVSLAARGALPGEPLYGVKVGLNEAVAGATALSGEAKVAWDLAAVEARLEETRSLLDEARLGEEKLTQIRENFEMHVRNLSARITELHTEGDYQAAARVAARLQDSLTTTGASLAGSIERANATAKEMVAPFAESIGAVLASTVITHNELLLKAGLGTSAEVQ